MGSDTTVIIVTYPSVWVSTLDRLWYDLSITVHLYP